MASALPCTRLPFRGVQASSKGDRSIAAHVSQLVCIDVPAVKPTHFFGWGRSCDSHLPEGTAAIIGGRRPCRQQEEQRRQPSQHPSAVAVGFADPVDSVEQSINQLTAGPDDHACSTASRGRPLLQANLRRGKPRWPMRSLPLRPTTSDGRTTGWLPWI